MGPQVQSPITPPWQDALDPQLVERLLQPVVQLGVTNEHLVRGILARYHGMTNPVLLLADFARRHGNGETATAGRVPIVYAQHTFDVNGQAQEVATPAASLPLPRPVVKANVAGQSSTSVLDLVHQPALAASLTTGPEPVAALGTQTPVVHVYRQPGTMQGGTRVVVREHVPLPHRPIVQAKMASSASPVGRSSVLVGLQQTNGDPTSGLPPETPNQRVTVSPTGTVKARDPAQSRATGTVNTRDSAQSRAHVPSSWPEIRPVVRTTEEVAVPQGSQELILPVVPVADHEASARGEHTRTEGPPVATQQPPSRLIVAEARRANRPQPSVPLTLVYPGLHPSPSALSQVSRSGESVQPPERSPRIRLHSRASELSVVQQGPLRSHPPATVVETPSVAAETSRRREIDVNELAERVQGRINLEALAEKVQRQLRRRFVVESERKGWLRWP